MPKKNLPTRTRASAASRPAARRLIILLLCALVPATAAVYVASAQRRAAVRGPSESRTPAASKESKEREREERGEREREARARARRQSDALRVGAPKRRKGPQTGRPWTGAAGVTRTNAAVMTAQARAPKASRRPRLMPEHEGPERRWLPHNPASHALTSTPNVVGRKPARGAAPTSSADAAGASAPQTVGGVNFNGVSLSDTGAFPPDTMGAVGPAQYVVAVNGRVRSFNKATGAADGVLNADTDVFFQSVMTPSPPANFTSDPRIRYDRLTKRWIVVIIDVPGVMGALPNRVMIAVTDAASNGVISGSTVWTYYQFRQDLVAPAGNTGEFADYPTLGVDANALYIGCNMFGGPGNGEFTGTTAFVVRKSSVLSGGPVVVTAFRDLLDPDTFEGPYTPQGVDNYDPAATEGYFIGVDGASFGTLALRRVSDPGGTPVLSANIPVTVADTSFPVPVPHMGNTAGAAGRLDPLDDRLFAAHIRGGRLWTAHNISVDTSGAAVDDTAPSARNAVRWYELNGVRSADNGGTPTVAQSGTLFDSAASSPRHFWIPSVMVTGQGHAALGFSTAGSAARIDAATTGRLASDAAGTLRTPTVQYTSSTFAYNPPEDGGGDYGRRWGDYSYTSLDPDDDMTMWTVQQYCDAANSYGVRVAKLLAPPPATPSSAGVSGVVAGQSSVNLTITGTSSNGSAFFDPGAGFPKHVTASVSNGITVNSVTYTDPTHVNINVSTVGATDGPASVTVINPDGQSATGAALFTVTGGAAAAASPVLITEFRFRGAAGGSDEFVELYNNTDSALTVADTNGGSGYAVAGTNTAGTNSLRCTVPNGTVIPARGHFLCANNAAGGYSLAAAAAANATYATGVVDGGGVAVFSTTVSANWGAATRLDAVGFQGITGTTLFTEGTALAPSGGVGVNGEYSFVRRMTTAASGLPQDTGNNEADFAFVSTTGAAFGGRQTTLGAPGPENIASPVNRNAGVALTLLDPSAGSSAAPNRTRDLTSDPANNSSFGTMTIRRTVTNNTGAAVTRLRFRVVDMTTFPAADPTLADLRLRTSQASTVSIAGVNAACPSGSCPMRALTLDSPSAANYGGLNSTVSAATVALATPLASGASVNVQFLLGIEKTGAFRFYVNVEALP